jgi:LuxR family transcriptional regulator, maltose regulon positive regulatory protein
VLARQPEQLTRFLLETSVLERLCGPLCDAVTGGADGQRLLETLERANLFLHPLDEQRRWYRYHHLFADLLRARLQQARPERVAELHRSAATWCEQHGLVDDAVRHHLAAGEAARVARLIERHVEELLLRTSERATMDRWAAALPAQTVRARPRLLLSQAISAEIEGRLDGVDDLLTVAERLPVADEPHQPSVGRAASVLANLPACIPVARAEAARLRGQPERAARFGRDARSRLTPEDELLGSFVRYHLACAEWLGGRLDRAERGLAEVVAERQAAGERYLAVRASYDLGLVQQAQGRLRAAMGTYRRGLGIVTRPGRPPLPAAGLALVGLAEILRERGDLDGALRHAIEGIERCRSLAYSPPLASGLVTLAWIRQARGEQDGAFQAMEEAQQVVPGPDVSSLHDPAPAERARLLLAHGRLEEALAWVEEQGLGEEDLPSYPREREYLLLARVLLAQQAPDRALALLQRLHELAMARNRAGSVIRIRAVQALALLGIGDHQQALGTLTAALSQAWPEGYIRVFADEGPTMAALLRRLVAARQRGRLPQASALPVGYLDRLLGAVGRVQQGVAALPAGEARAMAQGLVEPLTDRELQVLRLLAAGRRNQEVADELVVTVETVKKHTSHILDKLGAANRTQAVAHARQLGLIG